MPHGKMFDIKFWHRDAALEVGYSRRTFFTELNVHKTLSDACSQIFYGILNWHFRVTRYIYTIIREYLIFTQSEVIVSCKKVCLR